MRDRVSELMVLEKKMSLIEHVSPMIETIQTQAKVLRKEKKCPDDLIKEVSTMIFLAEVFNIPAFLRVKHQLTFKYGDKFIDKICGKKHANVDEEVVNMVEYSPDSKAVKARVAEMKETCKVREKEEEKAKKEAEKKKAEKGKKGNKKHHHHKKADTSSDDSSSDDSSSDSSSSEEKPKKKAKKTKKTKVESSSEEEKPKKKAKKIKKAESTDSESSEDEKPEKKSKKEKNTDIEKPAEVIEESEKPVEAPAGNL